MLAMLCRRISTTKQNVSSYRDNAIITAVRRGTDLSSFSVPSPPLHAGHQALRSPMTGEPMEARYFPCINLRNLVHEYIDSKQKEKKKKQAKKATRPRGSSRSA